MIEVDRLPPLNKRLVEVLGLPVLRKNIPVAQDDKHTYTDVDVSGSSDITKQRHNSLPFPSINNDPIDIDNDQIDIDNLIDINKKDLEECLHVTKSMTQEVTDIMLRHGSSSLMALDNASAYVETALRDGIGVNATLDTSVNVIVDDMLELKLVTFFLGKLDLPKKVCRRYLEVYMETRIPQTCEALLKKTKSLKYSARLRNLAGQVKEAATSEDTPAPAGVVKKLSDQKK